MVKYNCNSLEFSAATQKPQERMDTLNRTTTKSESIAKGVLVCLFFLILCLPCLLFLILGNKEVPLESEKEVLLEDFTIERYFNNKFQTNFESWFSTHYPMRGNFVLFYRQLKYDIDNLKLIPSLPAAGSAEETQGAFDVLLTEPPETTDQDAEGSEEVAKVIGYFDEDNPYAEINKRQAEDVPVEPTGFKGSDAVLIGKSGYLFESAYINEYYGYSEPYASVTDEGLAKLVERLTYIQEQLAKRDITFVFNLSSSKASQYSAFIPEWYKNTQYADDDYVRPYERLQDLLAESTINYVDSSELFKQIGLLATFPKTGIHWNHLASFEATRAIIDMYMEVSGNETKKLTLDRVIESKSPPSGGNSDQDIYNILYGTVDKTGSVLDEYYYSPKVTVENEEADPIGILLHGGSFSSDIAHYLQTYKIARPLRRFNYNNFMGSKKMSPYGELGMDAWERLLEDIDLVIFEMTEQQVRGEFPDEDEVLSSQGNGYMGHNVTYSSLYYYLKNNEIQ